MPASTWRANSTYASGVSFSTITLPAGYAVNDILLLAVLGEDVTPVGSGIISAGITNLTNNGWARVANTNTHLVGTSTQNVFMDIWWSRAATASQTAVDIGDSGGHTLAVCSAFSNVFLLNTSADPWVDAINISSTTATAQVNSRNIISTTSNTLAVCLIAGPRDSAAAQINSSPVLFNTTDEVELTERCDWGTASGTGSTLGILTYRKPGVGPMANVRANTATAQTYIVWMGALKGTIHTSQSVVV